MADQITTQGENTPEYIAYRLMEKIFSAEGKRQDVLDRKEILSTYAECVYVVRTGSYE